MLTWLLACHGSTVDTAWPDEADLPDRVVVLVMDGVGHAQSFGSASWQDGHVGLENYEQVARRLLPWGVTAPTYNTGVTVTAPAHCELTTGRPLHLGNFGTKQGPGAYLPEWPGLFHALDDAGHDALLGIGNTINLELMTRTLHPGSDEAADWRFVSEDALNPIMDDGVVADELIERLTGDDPPTLTVVNFHEVDRDGHAGLEAAYQADLSLLDSLVMEVWTALQADDRHAGRTLLVVTADHGRHDHEGNKGWLNHGDNCAGCRRVPLLMVGPGVKDGAVLDGPVTLHDLAPTLAHLLGVELPFAQGRVLTEALDAPEDAVSTSGPVDLAGGGRIWRRLGGGIELDGDLVSTSAFTAAPVLASGPAGTLACWRELTLEGADMPWRPHCRLDTGQGFEELAFAVDEVGPDWQLGLQADDTGFWAVFVDNVVGSTVEVEHPVTVRLLRLEDGAWVGTGGAVLEPIFPLFPAVASDAFGPVVAFAGSDNEEQARYQRRIQLFRPTWDDGVADWGERWLLPSTADWTGDGLADRQERPALHAGEDAVELAFLHHGTGGTTVATTQVGAAGVAPLDRLGELVQPGVAPGFGPDGRLWWAQSSWEGASVCVDASCQVVGARLDSIAPSDGGATYSASDDTTWATGELGG